jgi:hypothetical protein
MRVLPDIHGCVFLLGLGDLRRVWGFMSGRLIVDDHHYRSSLSLK